MYDHSLIQQDRQHWVHPVVQLREHEQRGATVWAAAEGIYLIDNNGKRVQDAFSGLWCVNAGYGQQSLIDAATRQLQKLPYGTGYFHFANEPAIRLASRLARLAPKGLSRVLFGQGGSDAVDTAVRVVRYFFNATGRPEKKHFIGLQRGYHGSSSTGSGLTALPAFHRYFDVPAAQQHHIPSPYAYRHIDGPDAAAVLESTVAALEAKVEEIGAERVAAFICEPIQGSGGVIVPPPGFLRAMRDACDRLGILLIVDEVITGFGRTGKLFACEHENVSPDIMTVAKGLTSGYVPMSATLVSEDVYQAMADAGSEGEVFGHGQTYAGHPVSAAVANAALDLYVEGGLVENGAAVGRYFLEQLKTLEELPHVGEVRGMGMLAAIELVADKSSKVRPPKGQQLGQRVLACAMEEGLVFRAFNDDILGFAPSLNYTRADVDSMMEILRFSLNKAVAENY
ncbi:aminotransferase class III-fold pyridoxal phosphate-dependent enzyme [Cupriavidus basilensis]